MNVQRELIFNWCWLGEQSFWLEPPSGGFWRLVPEFGSPIVNWIPDEGAVVLGARNKRVVDFPPALFNPLDLPSISLSPSLSRSPVFSASISFATRKWEGNITPEKIETLVAKPSIYILNSPSERKRNREKRRHDQARKRVSGLVLWITRF